jgi:NADH-quinone oxidoreductase subunit M
VFSGVYPKPMLDRIEPSVNKLLSHVEQHSNWHVPAVIVVKGEG